MKEIDWINTFIQQSSSVMTLWNVYIVVVLGIIGFIVQKGDSVSIKDMKIIIGAFILFALSNGIPLYQAQDTLFQIHEKMANKEMFTAHPAWVVALVQLTFDAIVLVFLCIRSNKALQHE